MNVVGPPSKPTWEVGSFPLKSPVFCDAGGFDDGAPKSPEL